MHRSIWRSTIDEVSCNASSWPLFVKSIEAKRIPGTVIRSAKDLIGCGCSGYNTPVICSDVLNFKAEWRCFVRYGKLLDVRQYRGEWGMAPDMETILSALASYTTAPAGYAIDFGLTDKGVTALVEVNEGYSLGNYGMQHNLYAQLLSARWAELTGCEDPCNFGVDIPLDLR